MGVAGRRAAASRRRPRALRLAVASHVRQAGCERRLSIVFFARIWFPTQFHYAAAWCFVHQRRAAADGRKGPQDALHAMQYVSSCECR